MLDINRHWKDLLVFINVQIDMNKYVLVSIIDRF